MILKLYIYIFKFPIISFAGFAKLAKFLNKILFNVSYE